MKGKFKFWATGMVLAVLAFLNIPSWAQNQQGGIWPGWGVPSNNQARTQPRGAWSGPPGWCGGIAARLICENGTPVTIRGRVVGVYPGRGYIIDTGSENVVVSGFGPVWYWKRMGIPRPRVGDEVTIEGYEVTFKDGSTAIFAVKIILPNGSSIQLRDPNTCYPLWFGRRNK
ncbi:hypothetical protein [Thermodesulfatator atlanticus]|uniref:hypothetical protein n=1 Tax=Thermodesulfatator atlanticus TaxID=501497 RepID=UPI0003B5C534|nr:hypothetical protein [Thermodesulfatator atlanticus]